MNWLEEARTICKPLPAEEPYRMSRQAVLNYWVDHAGIACTYPDVIWALYELGYMQGRLAEKEVK